MDTLPEKKENREMLLEIEELEEPFRKIILELKQKIEAGEFELLIGDDASGRIPALIMYHFMEKVAKYKNFSKPKLVFFPGKLCKENILEKITKNTEKDKKEVLILTDVIVGGNTLKKILDFLKKFNYKISVATIGFKKDFKLKFSQLVNIPLDIKIISGDYSRYDINNGTTSFIPWIYHRGSISGVLKDIGQIKSLSYKRYIEENEPHKSISNIQPSINKTRQDVHVLVDRLFEWYLTL